MKNKNMKKEDEIKTVVPALRFPEFRGMNEWEENKLNSLCDIINGKCNAQDHVEGGKYPLFDRSATMKYSNDYLYDCEAIIIPGEGVKFVPKYYIGKFNLHQRAYALKDFSCNGRFLFYSMEYYSGLLAIKAVKSTVLSLRLPILQNFLLYIPNNNTEQQKIADCLSSIDDLIEATAQKVEVLKEHKKGLMQRLFPAEGKNVPDLRFLEFQGAEEWKESSLDEYFDFKQGFQCPVEEQYDKQEHGMVRFIRIIDLTQPSTPYRYINDPGNQYYINKENLFMVRYGDPGLVGIGYEGIIANNLFQLIPKKKINPYFFYFLFSKEKTRIKGLSSSTSLSAINFTSLKAFKIVVSQNTDEQQKIADCLSSIDELIEVISRKVEILKEHKKGLMQQLFPKI